MNLENPYAPPMADLSAPGIEWMRTDLGGLSKTAVGLSLVYFGIVLLLLCVVLSLFAVIFPPVIMLTGAGIILAGIVMFVGPLFCLSVPPETGAKGLIIGSVTLQLVNMVFAGLQFAGIQVPGVEPLSQLVGILSAVLFVLFMRKLALFIGRIDLAGQAKKVLLMAGATVGLAIVGLTLVFAMGPALGVLMFAVMIMGLIVFVMYANLVNSLRKALKSTKEPS